VKKLISIGVALALVAIVVLPLGVGAAGSVTCPPSNYTYPVTFAKIPFAILQSGLDLMGGLLGDLATTLGLPTWLAPTIQKIAPWTGGPLSWTVDMLGWGVATLGGILNVLPSSMGIPTWLTSVVNQLACALFTPYTCIVGNNLSLNCT
jgi:hypothetical protein